MTKDPPLKHMGPSDSVLFGQKNLIFRRICMAQSNIDSSGTLKCCGKNGLVVLCIVVLLVCSALCRKAGHSDIS
jgi:hypothetical protein